MPSHVPSHHYSVRLSGPFWRLRRNGQDMAFVRDRLGLTETQLRDPYMRVSQQVVAELLQEAGSAVVSATSAARGMCFRIGALASASTSTSRARGPRETALAKTRRFPAAAARRRELYVRGRG